MFAFIFSLLAIIVVIVIFAAGTPQSQSGVIAALVLGFIMAGVVMFNIMRQSRIKIETQTNLIISDSKRDLSAFDEQIEALSAKIEENRRIANS